MISPFYMSNIDSENIINRTLLTNNNELNENLWKLSGYSNVPTIEDNIEELANSEFLHRIIGVDSEVVITL